MMRMKLGVMKDGRLGEAESCFHRKPQPVKMGGSCGSIDVESCHQLVIEVYQFA